MPTGWDSILTVILFDDCYTDGLEMLLQIYLVIDFNIYIYIYIYIYNIWLKDMK